MSWTPARVVGTLVVAGLTAGAALALSSVRVEAPPDRIDAAGGASTTTSPAPASSDAEATTTTAVVPSSSTTTTEVPIRGPVRLVETSRFDLRGVGPVEAGMTVHEAEQAAGRRFSLSPLTATGGRCSTATPAGLDGVTLVISAPGGATASDPKAGTIVRAAATVPPFATVSNVRVGAPFSEARSVYAGRSEEVRFGRGGVALTVKGRSGGDTDKALRIESTDGQSVTSLASGLLTALAAPDGCA